MVVVLVTSSLYGEVYDMDSNVKKKDSSNLIGEIRNDLRLTIYYIPLNILTLYPLKEKDVKDSHYYYKIEVKNIVLRRYVEDLEKIDTLKLQKAEDTKENIRIYYEFTSKNGKIYSVGLSGYKGDILINGDFYSHNKIFYDFVSKFIPYCEIEYFQKGTKNM